MERSRSSKRSYHYDQDSDSQAPMSRSKHRRHHNNGVSQHHRQGGDYRLPPPPPPPSMAAEHPAAAATLFQILCPCSIARFVVDKSVGFIKSVRQETGACITVHEPSPGDDELVIETSDDLRRDSEGRAPMHSPARDALILIHARIVDAEMELGGGCDDGDWGRGRLTTRLVVPRSRVGCLLGKGGKIIEQMKVETKTHIKILTRDQYTPQCVLPSEEIVQVVGDGSAVKKAIFVISSRLLESLHRDRGHFNGRFTLPERGFSPFNDFTDNFQNKSSMEASDMAPRFSAAVNRDRNQSFSSQQSGYLYEQDVDSLNEDTQLFLSKELVFRILCPIDKVENVMGASGIIDVLQGDVGVDVRIADPIPGSEECVIIITSDEGPDNELFPAQEALLHIQNHIVDLGPDKDNIITTRLLVRADEIGCLEGRDGSLSDIRRMTSANVQILSKENHPLCTLEADKLVQIVGEIRTARNALVQVTARLRNCTYRDVPTRKDLPLSSFQFVNNVGGIPVAETSSPVRSVSYDCGHQGSDPSAPQNTQSLSFARQSKEAGGSACRSVDLEEGNVNEVVQKSAARRYNTTLVTRTTLEVVIPEHAVPSLIAKSGNKLAQISEISGASVSLIGDANELGEKMVKISGSPEQSERAQSLLQGFILSTQDDAALS